MRNHLLQVACELEIVERIGHQPLEIVEFLVEDHFASGPACREGHDQIVPAARASRQNFAPGGKANDLDLKAGFPL